jgi:glucose-6-phosphate-specific signal transduction histidine kinase
MVPALHPEAVRIDSQTKRLAQESQEKQVDEERENVAFAAHDAERQVAKDLTPSAQQ